jgi:hypothetical protein
VENLYLQDYICSCHIERNKINNTFVWDMRQNSLLKVYIDGGSSRFFEKVRTDVPGQTASRHKLLALLPFRRLVAAFSLRRPEFVPG